MIFKHPRTQSVGMEMVVESFATSFSYDNTKWLWSLLGDSPTVTAEQAARLVKAANENSQVARAVSYTGQSIPVLIAELAVKVTPREEPSNLLEQNSI